MGEPAYAAASVRNSTPILGVLREELRNCRQLLEIGSGSGFHAVTFAAALPHLIWQTSDLAESHAWIESAIDTARIDNLRLPLLLDVREANATIGRYDAVYSCNTAHIMSFDAVRSMVALIGRVLSEAGVFILYGPFRRAGEFSTPSNAGFDEALRAKDSAMGIRDLEAMDELAAAASLVRERTYAMPANNLLLVWKKAGERDDET